MSGEIKQNPLLPQWLTAYRTEWLRPDVIAGLTTAAVVIPKAMAYATIAGLPVEVGLYTAFLPMLIYAVLGTSRFLSVSTTTTLAILLASELNDAVPNPDPAALLSATAIVTLLVGAILAASSLLRLGFVADFISEPVLIGFKAGIGLVIIVDQVPKLLGFHIPRGSFGENLGAIASSLPKTSLATLIVGAVMIILLVSLAKLVPKVPAPLVAVAGGIVAAYFLGLQAHGVELVGPIPQGLPPLSLPQWSLAGQLWPGALAIALMSFTESIAAGRAFANPRDPAPRSNRELLATGLANVGGAFFGAMPSGGGTSQTAVNRSAGARTQLAEVVTAAAALAVMMFLSPFLALMPQATLAAVVVVYSIGLIKPGEFMAVLRIRRTEFIWALVAFAGVVLLGTLKGIIVAIIVSLIALAYQAANPPVYVLRRKPGTNVFRPQSTEHPADESFPGLLLLRLEGRVFFANAGHIGQRINAMVDEQNPRVVGIDFSGVPDLEYTALKLLTQAEKRLREQHVALWLVGLNPEVLAMVNRSQLGEALGRGAMHFNLETAVARYLESTARE